MAFTRLDTLTLLLLLPGAAAFMQPKGLEGAGSPDKGEMFNHEEWYELNPSMKDMFLEEWNPNSENPTLEEFAHAHRSEKTCLTTHGGFGGFSNTMSYLNTLVERKVTIGKELDFAFPETIGHKDLHVPLHNVFGNDVCKKEVDVHKAGCNFDLPASEQWKGTSNFKDASPCYPSQLVVSKESERKTVSWCNCDRVVVANIEDVKRHFNYSVTGDFFREKYWATNAAQLQLPDGYKMPGSAPISVAMHVRLGDVAKNGIMGKYTPPAFYIQTLKALEKAFPKDTMRVRILTDSANHSDVHAIINAARDDVTVVGDSTVNYDFHYMAHSDILVVGSSGFGLYTTILQAHTEPSFRITVNKGRRSHPIGYLKDTLYVADETDQDLTFEHISFDDQDAIKSLRRRV